MTLVKTIDTHGVRRVACTRPNTRGRIRSLDMP